MNLPLRLQFCNWGPSKWANENVNTPSRYWTCYWTRLKQLLTFLKMVEMASQHTAISASIFAHFHCLSRTCTAINGSTVQAEWIIHSGCLVWAFFWWILQVWLSIIHPLQYMCILRTPSRVRGKYYVKNVQLKRLTALPKSAESDLLFFHLFSLSFLVFLFFWK